jgi:hypothetical protein
VLGGGDEHAFLHQTGGVADAGDVATLGFDFVIVEIYAAEDDAIAGRSGQDTEVNGSAAVQANTLALYRATDCLLIKQGDIRSKRNRLRLERGIRMW